MRWLRKIAQRFCFQTLNVSHICFNFYFCLWTLCAACFCFTSFIEFGQFAAHLFSIRNVVCCMGGFGATHVWPIGHHTPHVGLFNHMVSIAFMFLAKCHAFVMVLSKTQIDLGTKCLLKCCDVLVFGRTKIHMCF